MSTMTDTDIDLYADVDGDFAAEDFVNESGHFFDDLVTNGQDEKRMKPDPDLFRPPASHSHPTKRYQLCIGNLTW